LGLRVWVEGLVFTDEGYGCRVMGSELRLRDFWLSVKRGESGVWAFEVYDEKFRVEGSELRV